MSTRRRARLALLVPAVLLALLWPTAAQATYAAEEIGLSTDGVTWAPELTVPLFEAERRWVPGDDETRTFHVRNQGPSAASMTVEVLDPGGDGVLAADMSVSLRVDGGAWAPVELGSTPQQVTLDRMAVDGAAPVDVRAAFDPASGNRTQNRLMPLTLRITLVGDVPPDDGSGDSDASAPGHGGPLPDTGAAVGPESLLAALALCVAGAFLIARRSSGDAAAHGAVR